MSPGPGDQSARDLRAEFAAVEAAFGADAEQVRRDHLISHVLAAISSALPTDDVVFFGGTALSRTHLVQGRLSEDIDLIATAPRGVVAPRIEAAVARGLARSHGRPSWRPLLSATSGSDPAVLSVPAGIRVQVQLLSGDGYSWPTEVVDLEQRYSDAPPARMRTLTAAGFAAAKLAAWIDREAPRDLFDLWALSANGLITSGAVEVFVRLGPFGRPAPDWVFDRVPTADDWSRALAHQTILTIGSAEAAEVVRDAWRAASTGPD